MSTHSAQYKRNRKFERLEAEARKWNKRHPLGTKLRYVPEQFPTGFESKLQPFETEVTGRALAVTKPDRILAFITWRDGRQACVNIDRLEPISRKAMQP